jgi:hypothetical protein
MFDWLIRYLQVLETPVSWIVNIIQLLGYIIGGPIIFFRHKRRLKKAEEKYNFYKTEYERCLPMLHHAICVLRYDLPKSFKEFEKRYGGKGVFDNILKGQLPEFMEIREYVD